MFEYLFGKMDSDDKLWAIFWICFLLVLTTTITALTLNSLFAPKMSPLQMCVSYVDSRNSTVCVELARQGISK